MKKILAVIPARSGSKRIPDKNIATLGGKPLLAWSIEAALQCEMIDKVVVSSDSEKYLKIAVEYGAEGILRSEEASSDTARDYDVLWEICQYYPECEYFIYLRPTTPFRDVRVVGEAIRHLLDDPQRRAAGLRSFHKSDESGFKLITIAGGQAIPIGPYNQDAPDQELPITYKPNGYVDIVTRNQLLLLNNRCWGDAMISFVTPEIIEIDTLSNLKYAEYTLKITAKEV